MNRRLLIQTLLVFGIIALVSWPEIRQPRPLSVWRYVPDLEQTVEAEEIAAFSATAWFTATVSGASLVTLALLGTFAARVGGAPLLRGATRVTLWGALAMIVTGMVGSFFGTSV